MAASLMPTAQDRLRARTLELLHARGETARALAKSLGHGDSWASNFLSGKRNIPVASADKVAAFFRIDVQLLFGEADLSRHMGEVQPAFQGGVTDAGDGAEVPSQQAENKRLRDALGAIAEIVEAIIATDLRKTRATPPGKAKTRRSGRHAG